MTVLDPETGRRRVAAIAGRVASVACAVCLATLALGASAAPAETTHLLERTITLPPGYTAPQPSGVDKEGNILVWLDGQSEIAKFDPNGNPVNFSGLGTNILDGHGGTNCPAVPADCDRVPTTNGFEGNATDHSFYWGYENNIVAVDHSGGPADGYIYVENNYSYNYPTKHHFEGSEVDVFNEAGKFVGILERGAVGPTTSSVPEKPGNAHCGNCQLQGISVSPNGTLYTVVGEYDSHVDAFVPVDGNPTHDQFIGQFNAKPDPETGGLYKATLYKNAAAGEITTSTSAAAGASKATKASGSSTRWKSSRTTARTAATRSTSRMGPRRRTQHGMGVFEESGVHPSYNDFLKNIAIDPKTENAFIWGDGPEIQEWREAGGDFENKEVGPGFGAGSSGAR